MRVAVLAIWGEAKRFPEGLAPGSGVDDDRPAGGSLRIEQRESELASDTAPSKIFGHVEAPHA